MRSLTGCLAAAVACITLAGCHRPAEIGPAEVHPDVLAKAGLQYYWRLTIPLDDGETITRLVRLDENLYCLTDRNRVFALDAVRGEMKWIRTLASTKDTVFAPCHADAVVLTDKPSGMKEIFDRTRRPATKTEPFDAVLFNSLSYVTVIDRATGRVVRDRIDLGFPANTGGATDGMLFFVGSIKGLYHAIALQEEVPLWTLSTGDLLRAPLVYHSRRVYVGGEDGAFYAANVYPRHKQAWRRQTDGPITAAFHVDKRGCFVPSEDNRLYALDPATGRWLWEPFICQGPLRDAVQVAERSLFQYAVNDRLYAIDLANGRQRWNLPDGRVVLAVMDGEAYILDRDNNLVVANEMTGEQGTSLPMTGYRTFLPNTTAPAIYAVTAAGKIDCIRPLGAGYITPEQMSKP